MTRARGTGPASVGGLRSEVFRSIVILSILISGCATAEDADCRAGSLRPGTYELTLVNSGGIKAGSRVSGALVLSCSQSSDVSPRTGRGPSEDEDLEHAPLYGHTEIDLPHVLEHALQMDDVPHPSSTDPIYPGALVLRIDGIESFPKDPVGGSTVLLLGTVSNRRDGEHWRDGPGIGLFIETVSESKLTGSWAPWGVVQTGSGTFTLVPIR